MRGEEIVEVGGSVEGGSTGGIYRLSSMEQWVIYRCVYSVRWSVDRVVSLVYSGEQCAIYSGIYNRVLWWVG